MNPFEILKDIRVRATEAIIAQSNLSHPDLARHLRKIFMSDGGKDGALLGEPVVEGAHPFESADLSLQDLANKLLHPDLIDALDKENHGGYRFPRERRPFKHQLSAWNKLANTNDTESVLVTSGTGSGKTECFLIPLLNHLVGQLGRDDESLTGVQAIMLYPLNALIESQKERLSAWTMPFGGRIRFCLYNGDLKQAMDAETKKAHPEQVLDRETLRKNPPPILVTNKTMLEYMLARLEDTPILKQSKGKLRWIILDEAHSLVGSSAAEVALLLRRVLLGFGVSARDVRFVATSATIGSGSDVAGRLKKFLAELAGIDDAKVHVIEGHRVMPRRTHSDRTIPLPADLRSSNKELIYRAFASKPEIWSLVEQLYRGAVAISEVRRVAECFELGLEDLVYALTNASLTDPVKDTVEILAPLRLHAFERAVPGVWSCINPQCSGTIEGWQFGAIATERCEYCRYCTAPVLELLVCSLCGEAILEGVELDGQLMPPLRSPPRDEFQFESEQDDDGNDSDDDDTAPVTVPITLTRYFAAHPSASARPFYLEQNTWSVLDLPSPGSLTLRSEDVVNNNSCPCCLQTSRTGDPLRPIRFGAPSLIANTAPILLEGLPPSNTQHVFKGLPFGGRQLLSFTDSRQGTARMSAKMQTEAERNFVRSFIYHTVQSQFTPNVDTLAQIEKAKSEISVLQSVEQNSIVKDMIDELPYGVDQ